MFYKSKEIIFDDRTFLVKFRPDWGGRICECKIYELVRPTWKLFKYKYLDYVTFLVEEYNTIDEGLKWMVISYWKREASENILKEKWSKI